MGWPWRKQCLRGCDIGDHCNAQEGRGTLGMQYPGKRCNTLGRDAILAGDEAALPAQGNVVSKGIAVSWGGCCSSLLRLAGSGHGSVGIPCPWDAGIPVLELEDAGPHTNLKIGQQAMIKPWKICRAPAVGLHPAAFPELRSHRSCSQQILPSSAPCSWPLCLFSHRFILSVSISQ